jgi:SAM-dependent methyltransferase
LDVATGPGYVASIAAGLGADVVGVDSSEQMIAKARRLFPGTDFRVGDAEDLPFPDATFDRVVMNFGLLHMGEPDQAIREAQRVLRPGGVFGFTVWASPEEAGGFSLLSEAVIEFGQPVAMPEGPDFYYYSQPENCRAALTKIGFVDTRAEMLDLTWRLDSIDDLFPAYLLATVRTGALLAGQEEQDRVKIEQRVRETAAQFRAADGTLVIPMPAVASWARRRDGR